MGKPKNQQKTAVASNHNNSLEALSQSLDNMSLFQDIKVDDPAHDHQSMSGLEKLPGKARKEILRYLLHADRVRQPMMSLGIRKYHFETAILRVNHRLATEAQAVLYGENTIIRVQFYKQMLFPDSMLNHEVSFLHKGDMTKFEKYVVSIVIKPDELSPLAMPHVKKNVEVSDNTFIVLKQDLPKFTRYLRIMDIANSVFFNFKFVVRSTVFGEALSLSEQKSILEPFKMITGTKLVQTVSITGNVDKVLAASVTQAMTQKAQWARAGAWELFDIAASMKAVGDELWNAGFTDIARSKWDDAGEWIVTSLKGNELLTNFDSRADDAGFRIHLTCNLDIALYELSPRGSVAHGESPDYKEVLEACVPSQFQEMAKRVGQDKNVFERPLIHYERRAFYFRGIAELGLGHPAKAAKNFAAAFKLNSQNVKYRAGYNIARDWKDSNETERRDRLQSILDDLPEPFPQEDWKPYSTFEVKSEQYCLRKLGFKGDFPLQDKIKGAYGTVMAFEGGRPRVCTLGAVKYSKMEEYLKVLRAQPKKGLEEARRAGQAMPGVNENTMRKLMFWVQLSPGQLGEGMPGFHYPENEGE
ncbi:hypothetical protein MMC10_003712 [Thelotrema lepadinum]|nr:hypothetical protein [Thelotrema lepadinum]